MSAELGSTGKQIWDAFNAAQLSAPHQALVRELARCADNLDRIDGLVSGRQESWAELAFDDMGQVQLSIDKITDEQRKTQAIYKQLYAELRTAGIKAGGGSLPAIETEDEDDMLTKRRKEKEARERQLG